MYAGVGLFAAALAGQFEQVTAVESSASSVRDLRENLRNGKHRVVASSTLDFLKSHNTDGPKPNLVIVDPPRAGLGKDVTELLSRIGAPKLTYISCDPATLARDLQWLLHSGYHLNHITLVDLFPQTYHLETIAELSR
jgi:23S rRNA (uracil1939-C5)-methyltransferase